MTLLVPGTEDEAADMIAASRSRGESLAIEGGGTQRGLGRPIDAATVLSSRALTGVTLHEPAELVISAKAGTPLREIESKLAAANQILPFEPVDLRALFGTDGEPTIGGVVAGNWSGPRRIAAGAARDHLIGVRFVNGRGEIVKSGGRVMKNVTGLDLVKLQCGAHGTLGFLTEVTFKLLPKAASSTSLVYPGLDDARAVRLLSTALTSPFEVSGAAHLPPGIGEAGARTVLRLENVTTSLDYRCDRIRGLTEAFGRPTRLDKLASDALWVEIRDVRFLAEPRDRAVWRISVPPNSGPEVVDRLERDQSYRHFYDWGGGLVWLAVPEADDGGADAVRAAIASCGGHATLIRASDRLRSAVPVFQPLAAPLMALTRRLKASFDPDTLINPGRMYADA